MHHLTRAMIAPILNALSDRDGPKQAAPFDAHMVEQRCLRLHPVEFAEELLRFRKSPDPLQQFSAAVAQRIDRTFVGQIRKTQKVRSTNLGGTDLENQEWEKAVPGPII